MLRAEGRSIYFSSGRKIEPSGGIVGLSYDMELFEGYDASLSIRNDLSYDIDTYDMSPEDAIELADHMIELWKKFKATMQRGAVPDSGA